MPLHGCIFDLDGVLTDTAEYHYQAWQRLADELGSRLIVNATKRSGGSHAAVRWNCSSPGASIPKRRCWR